MGTPPNPKNSQPKKALIASAPYNRHPDINASFHILSSFFDFYNSISIAF